MFPTYRDGQINYANRWAYRWKTPERGDVVVIMTTGEQVTILKRIVGMPGERVRMENGRIYIDGALLEEPTSSRKEAGGRRKFNLAQRNIGPLATIAWSANLVSYRFPAWPAGSCFEALPVDPGHGGNGALGLETLSTAPSRRPDAHSTPGTPAGSKHVVRRGKRKLRTRPCSGQDQESLYSRRQSRTAGNPQPVAIIRPRRNSKCCPAGKKAVSRGNSSEADRPPV